MSEGQGDHRHRSARRGGLEPGDGSVGVEDCALIFIISGVAAGGMTTLDPFQGGHPRAEMTESSRPRGGLLRRGRWDHATFPAAPSPTDAQVARV